MTTTLTDAELARLEELAELYLSGNALPFAESDYRESACNAVPLLVAEVQRLREKLEHMKHGMEAAYMSGRADGRKDAEAESAALRDRIEALEWLVECIDNYEWNSNRSGWFVAQGVAKEAKATMQAAREAMK